MGRTMNEQYNDQIQLLKKVHRWRLAFFGIIILIAGIVIGAAGAMIYKASAFPEPPKGIEFVNANSMKRLKRELNLSEEQSVKIEKIFNDHLKVLSDIRKQARSQIAEEMNGLYADVLKILDKQQQEQWDKSIQRLREHITTGRKRFRRGTERDSKKMRPGPDGRHRPFNMWERQQNGEKPMRRRREPGMDPGPDGPGPDGFGPPPEDDLPESKD